MSRNKGHRLRWLALISSGLLLVVFGAGFLWWQHYKTTPAYSLALVVDAAQRNDDPAFDRLVDMEKVIDSFIQQVAQTATIGLASDAAASLRTQLQFLTPDVVASIQQTIKEEIRERINEVAGADRPFLITALAIPFKANISESDETAKVTINSDNHQLGLTMERLDDSQWKVISVRDDALAARLVNDIVKNLPGPGSQLDKEMRKQLQDVPGTLPKLPFLDDK